MGKGHKSVALTKSGFTLIELLIVISILGILTGLVAINFNQARMRARDVARKNDLKQIQKALELYKDEQAPQKFPENLTELVTGNYMSELPIDPREKGLDGSWVDYSYERTDFLTYTLYACLENESDTDKDAVNICSTGVSYTLNEP